MEINKSTETKNIIMLGLIDPAKNDASKIHFYELANSFVKLNNKVTLIVPKNKIDESLIEDMKVIKLPFNYTENFLMIFLLSIFQIFYYLIFSSKKHNMVYIRWRLLPCFPIKIINRIKKLPTKIFSEHNGWIKLEAKIQHKFGFYSFIGYWLQILDAKFADKVIAVTQGIKDKLVLANIDVKNISVIGNGTNITHFYPMINREQLKFEKLNLKDKIILGFIGNISKWQGIDSLIDIFKTLAKQNKNIVLLVIGSGIYLEEIKKNIKNIEEKDRIIFKSNIDYSEVNLWMNIIDIAFSPKSYILNEIGYSPLKIRDYSAAGRPVISTNVNGIKELELHGWLKVYKNEDECNRIITSLIEYPEKIEVMGKKAREYAENEFSWNIVAQKILRILA